MKLSIITPSFNQGEYIEETIDSVLSQNIKNLEYIIMDGGSTDNTVEIIKKYERHISHWVSKKDGGQTDAIEKGFQLATGDILGFINSDDSYVKDTFRKVLMYFNEYSNLEFLYGDYAMRYDGNRLVSKPKISYDYDICLNAYLMIPQPSSFWTRNIYDKVGGFNTNFNYCFDYDYFLKIGKALKNNKDGIKHVNDIWSLFRVHEDNKSLSGEHAKKFSAEMKVVRNQYGFISNPLIRPAIKYYYLSKALAKFYKERRMIPLYNGPADF